MFCYRVSSHPDDTDKFMDDIKKKMIFKKLSGNIPGFIGGGKENWNPASCTAYRNSLVVSTQGMSTALDARLEFGLETQAELRLKVR